MSAKQMAVWSCFMVYHRVMRGDVRCLASSGFTMRRVDAGHGSAKLFQMQDSACPGQKTPGNAHCEEVDFPTPQDRSTRDLGRRCVQRPLSAQLFRAEAPRLPLAPTLPLCSWLSGSSGASCSTARHEIKAWLSVAGRNTTTSSKGEVLRETVVEWI